ncbi:MAG: Gfo/Idh/MocA family oxidoreductase [Candidatus Omnitrophota bacterium]|jgi:predicted dehydrogenase
MLKIGIIGCGYWGPNLIRSFGDIDEVVIDTIADLSEERLAQFKKRMPHVTVTRNGSDIIKNPSIDAVVIATPANTHYALAKEALLSGKHVFVEKPLTFDLAEAEELVKIADKAKKVLMVGHTFEYNPAVEKIREYITKKELGDVYYLTSRRLNLGKIREDINAMWNLAPHDISIFIYLLGAMPLEVRAWGASFLQKDIEDLVFVTLTFPGNVTANIQVSWLDPLKVRDMVVVGSKKMVVYDDVDNEGKIKIYDKGADKLVLSQAFGEFQIKLRAGDVLIPKLPMTEPLKKECMHFVDCIINNKTPLTDGRNGLRVVRVLTAAQESLKNGGKAVKL